MTRKKKRELEEARLAEERRRTDEAERNAAAAQPLYFPGVSFGSLNGMSLPVSSGQMNAIQLPPIIQPISFVPTPMQAESSINKSDDFDDDFDDFDDWD